MFWSNVAFFVPTIIYTLLFKTPQGHPWLFILLWLLRLFTFSLLLRTYILPWLVARLAKTARIRSVSLRSIRGLFLRLGTRTIHVERIGWQYSPEGAVRVAITVEGCYVEVHEPEGFTPSIRGRHRRALTLANVTSDIQHSLWGFVSWGVSQADPIFRPAARSLAVASLRYVKNWLPSIAAGTSLHVYNSRVVFTGTPRAQISCDDIKVHASLVFRPQEHTKEDGESELTRQPARFRRSYGMAAWRRQFTKSFRKAWDRALAETRTNMTWGIKIHGIEARVESEDPRSKVFSLPGNVSVQVDYSFNFAAHSIESHSMTASVDVGEITVNPRGLQSFFDLLKTYRLSSPPSPAYPPESPSFATPLYSGSSSMGLKTPDPSGIISMPSSPFLETLSSTILPRRNRYQPCKRLKDIKTKGKVSVLQSLKVHIAAVKLRPLQRGDQAEADSYHTTLRNVSFQVGLSDITSNPIHCQWMGRGDHLEVFESDVYSATFSMRQVKVERITPLTALQLLRVGPLNVCVMCTQWPAPWLVPSPFIGGDPNGPFLAIRITCEGVQLSDHVDHIQTVVGVMSRSHKPRNNLATETLYPEVPMPRITFELHCGTIGARLDLGEPGQRAIELRSDGFAASVTSYYRTRVYDRPFPDSLLIFDTLPVQLEFCSTFSLKPTFLRIRRQWAQHSSLSFPTFSSSDADYSEDPALLSLETLDVEGTGSILADIRDDTQNLPCLDISSLALNLAIASDALCIELWHVDVVESLARFLRLVPRSNNSDTMPLPLIDRLPVGISVTFSLHRSVAFVASPDINPNDETELSRGIALSVTGFSFQYCSLQPCHTYLFLSAHKRSLQREQLGLSDEQVLAAFVAAKALLGNHRTSAFLRFSVTELTIRSATATPYVPDDPLLIERDDPVFEAQQFLRASGLRADITVSRRVNTTSPEVQSVCGVMFQAPKFLVNLSLSHIYNTLLATTLIKGLLPRSGVHPPTSSPMITSFTCNASVTDIRLSITLPTQELVCHIDSTSAVYASGGPRDIRWHHVNVLVRLHQRRGDRTKEEWGKLVSLHRGDVFIPSVPGAIVVDLDSARLRIPYGFVVADLIRDASVTVKAARHLARMTDAAQFFPMPSPSTEGPKCIPQISLQVAFLCAEFEDDPFESRLNFIWQTARSAQATRLEREEAFAAKVSAILTGNGAPADSMSDDPALKYRFNAAHTVAIEDARDRLHRVHFSDWLRRLQIAERACSHIETQLSQRLHDSFPAFLGSKKSSASFNHPPLFRAILTSLSLTISQPSFAPTSLPDFLHEQGRLPRESQYTLLVPLHLYLSLSSLRMDIRDYPIPLANIPPHPGSKTSALEFDTDLVVAEELGPETSIDWVECPIIPIDDHYGHAPWSISVPKTLMPVKSYANPDIHVTTTDITTLAWAISYGPATQDIMRVIETLSHFPRDPSPAIGFWDKLRLVFHWSIRVSFKGEVRYIMKGQRDPYSLNEYGPGFALAWQGNPKLLISRENDDKELVQLISDTMLIVVPSPDTDASASSTGTKQEPNDFLKTCAKFRGGVRFGLGFVLERTCGPDCMDCSGTPFYRRCRMFDFKPHHQVKLAVKGVSPLAHSLADSYAGFRSDFIHLSISLTSSIRPSKPGSLHPPSNLHLSPKLFKHFWSWWGLFDGALSLPIRQGSYYPRRHQSPKFGRHLATIKYRVKVSRLFLTHGYVDDSRDTWADRITSWIGVKGMIDEFQVDMHQREQETTVPGVLPNTIKVIRRKPFYAAELVMRGLDLRAMFASFNEPMKAGLPNNEPSSKSSYRSWDDLPSTDTSSPWYDPDDFVEFDWIPPAQPDLHVLPVVACPRFIYFKRNSARPTSQSASSKFGDENTHQCLLGKEPSASAVQASLASARVSELRTRRKNEGQRTDSSSTEKMIALLEQYISVLQGTDPEQSQPLSTHYEIPSDTITPDEWAEFDHVYHVHCPKIFMDNAIRDIMMQYYHLSRARRGFEYHMAARAVKFIRDQAKLIPTGSGKGGKSHGHMNTAQVAAFTLRKILVGERSKSTDEEPASDASSGAIDPMNGWSEGVSLSKAHCFLLLKPQIVLRNRSAKEETCILTALQAKLQSFAIMDDSNADDPVSGKVMSRTYALLSGLQAFSPNNAIVSADGCVPLEVLIDFRCETNAFDRLVPQTDATFHYDKFNRLRLRNNITSAVGRRSTDSGGLLNDNYLQDQTDLVQIHIPRFTVTASDQHFQTISKIVTKLLLFSDAAQKTRLDKLETLLFTYDFTDLSSAANVVEDLQRRVRAALSAEQYALRQSRLDNEPFDPETPWKFRAHTFLLTEELGLLFDAIKLAQDRQTNDKVDQKSALLLNASSTEISWNMLDHAKDLLAKLVVSDIDYYWLSRQDSGTVNNLTVGNMQAFDGSRNAVWAEILSKLEEPVHHPLQKKGLFLLSNWSVLPPVGGITIYEAFELSFHPLRLQIDARVGRRIMEYVWPARRERNAMEAEILDETSKQEPSGALPRTSLDSARPFAKTREMSSMNLSPPGLRRLGTSRSFTDLRMSASEHPGTRLLNRVHSSEALRAASSTPESGEPKRPKSRGDHHGGRDVTRVRKVGDADEMRTRSSQKTFVLVRISSMNLCLSVMKEESFVCHDARIRTRDLEYRNQTWSFEELVDQFIPSDMSWKGWVKMAFHQPLVPVLPVARELLSKTKWISVAKNGAQNEAPNPPAKLRRVRAIAKEAKEDGPSGSREVGRSLTPSPIRGWKKASHRRANTPPSAIVSSLPLTSEPEPLGEDVVRPPSRHRVRSLFSSRTSSKSSKGDSVDH